MFTSAKPIMWLIGLCACRILLSLKNPLYNRASGRGCNGVRVAHPQEQAANANNARL
jgi:hypothetical protein